MGLDLQDLSLAEDLVFVLSVLVDGGLNED